VVLVFATYSGVGTQADERLAAHMIEHILIWLLAAPLLVAGAPVRLTLFALGSSGRRRVARVLGSPTAKVVTGPARSTAVFFFLILISALPPLYDLTLRSELIHVGEHGLYMVAACLVWAPLIGADPLPHRPSAASRCACAAGCTFSMTLVSLWLLLAPAPVYRLNEQALGPLGALRDQRLAATIMLLAAVPGLILALSARVGNVVRATDPPGGVSQASRSTA
jgi:cytochrome c oxidase assembly factor CtaG